MNKRIDNVDLNTRHLLKHQFEAIGAVQRSIKVLDKMVTEEFAKRRNTGKVVDEDLDSPSQLAIQRMNEDK